ncbi:MAG: hypothetical protein ACYCPS_02025 [Candidatus Saccharimonadales bacterium]
MDTISSLLNGKEYQQPDEIDRLKRYILTEYNSQSTILLTPKGFTILVSSSSLANTIRLNLPRIKKQLAISNRLSIRIG